MPQTRTRPTRDQTRERILDAAAEVFTERGFEGSSIDQVAAAAGLTKGAVYSSFATKDELFFALVTSRLEQRVKLVAEPGTSEKTLAELFAEAEADLARLMTSQRGWHVLFIECWVRAVRDAGRQAQWAAMRRETQATIASFLARHQAAGAELALPPDDLAIVSMALSNGLAMEHIAAPDAVDPGLFARTMEALS